MLGYLEPLCRVLITLPEGVRVAAQSSELCRKSSMQTKMLLRPQVVAELAAFADYLATASRQIARAVQVLTPAKCDASAEAGTTLECVPHLRPCQHVEKTGGPWVGMVSGRVACCWYLCMIALGAARVVCTCSKCLEEGGSIQEKAPRLLEPVRSPLTYCSVAIPRRTCAAVVCRVWCVPGAASGSNRPSSSKSTSRRRCRARHPRTRRGRRSISLRGPAQASPSQTSNATGRWRLCWVLTMRVHLRGTSRVVRLPSF